ncbi:D-alanine--D-alanine ligase family protein [Oenococcus oeni]|uniref:D-alanine--D-alanine ligase family protein n=2 Tax=Oenococcus oeni TaxID=1247 RepID=UPI0008F9104B|nr:D-alanine--D-alanine ligase family protein [Oenococcus oeni]OIK87984.1 D-alanine--D-alanine ligase [Oenococcus oeni]OLQ36833.1 D-alanine--D-alanine ligase [Oenococcus oeni]
MAEKIRVGLFFGGNSSEHDVSKRSAKNYYDALDPEKYQIFPVLISKKGIMIDSETSKRVLFGEDEDELLAGLPNKNADIFGPIDSIRNLKLDVLFPSVHGNLGEDGTLAGLFRLMNIPYVGSGLRAHAISFDKVITKELMTVNGIRNTKYIVIFQNDKNKPDWDSVSKQLGEVVFVKAANQGSSVGVSRVTNAEEYENALRDSFQYDEKLLVEKAVESPTELEIGLLGNDRVITSLIGAHWAPGQDHGSGWFDYKNKFVDNSKMKYQIPAKISPAKSKELENMAVKAYKVLGIKGFARIDFLMSKDGEIFLSEPNTLPGNTNMSLFPILFEAAGMNRSQQAEKLIQLAFEEFKREQNISYSFKELGSEKLGQFDIKK